MFLHWPWLQVELSWAVIKGRTFLESLGYYLCYAIVESGPPIFDWHTNWYLLEMIEVHKTINEIEGALLQLTWISKGYIKIQRCLPRKIHNTLSDFERRRRVHHFLKLYLSYTTIRYGITQILSDDSEKFTSQMFLLDFIWTHPG